MGKKTVWLLCILILIGGLVRLIPAQNHRLIDPDSYYHYRITRDTVESGKLPEWDYLSHAPEGRPADYPPLLHVVAATAYYPFAERTSLLEFTMLFGWLVGLFSAFAVYILAKKLYGAQTALFSTIVLLSMPIQIEWGSAGIFSATMLGVGISIFSLYFGYSALEGGSRRHTLAYFVFSTLNFFTWRGWLLGIAPLVLYAVLKKAVLWEKWKRIVALGLAVFLIGLILAVPETGGYVREILFEKNPLEDNVAQKTIPDIWHAVWKLSFLSLFSLGGLFIALKRRSAGNLLTLALLSTTTILLLQGYRYLLFFSIPIAILCGGFLGYLASYKKPERVAYFSLGYALFSIFAYGFSLAIVLALLLLLILLRAVKMNMRGLAHGALIFLLAIGIMQAYATAKNLSPKIGSAKMEALAWISENTEKDAVVFAFWDEGHYITAVGKRRVVMDNYFYYTDKVYTGKEIEKLRERLVLYKRIYALQHEHMQIKKASYEKEVEIIKGWIELNGIAEKRQDAAFELWQLLPVEMEIARAEKNYELVGDIERRMTELSSEEKKQGEEYEQKEGNVKEAEAALKIEHAKLENESKGIDNLLELLYNNRTMETPTGVSMELTDVVRDVEKLKTETSARNSLTEARMEQFRDFFYGNNESEGEVTLKEYNVGYVFVWGDLPDKLSVFYGKHLDGQELASKIERYETAGVLREAYPNTGIFRHKWG